MKKKIAIIGSGKHALMLKELIINDGYHFIGFFDDKKKKNLKKKILGNFKDLDKYKKKIDFLLLGIGDNFIRGSVFKKLKKKNFQFLTFIHSSSKFCKSAKIEEGTVALIGTIINSNSIIGKASIINSGSIIEHDCKISFSCHICPGTYLAGGVEIGEYSFVGIGSRVIQNIKIFKKVIIGAGSIILKDIKKVSIITGIYS